MGADADGNALASPSLVDSIRITIIAAADSIAYWNLYKPYRKSQHQLKLPELLGE